MCAQPGLHALRSVLPHRMLGMRVAASMGMRSASLTAVKSVPFLANSSAHHRCSSAMCGCSCSRHGRRWQLLFPKVAHHRKRHSSAELDPLTATKHSAATTRVHAALAGSDAAVAAETQQQQIDVFISFLLEENEKYNLTGASHCLYCSILFPHWPALITAHQHLQVQKRRKKCGSDTLTTAWHCYRCWMPPRRAAQQPLRQMQLRAQQHSRRSRNRASGCSTSALAPAFRVCCWLSAARSGRW